MANRTTQAASVKLRITARGQAVLIALVAVVAAVIAMSFLLGVTGAQASAESSTNDFTYVSVASGQSLWQLATLIAPESDPRDVIAEIVQLNSLPSADVEVGQRLAIPERYAG